MRFATRILAPLMLLAFTTCGQHETPPTNGVAREDAAPQAKAPEAPMAPRFLGPSQGAITLTPEVAAGTDLAKVELELDGAVVASNRAAPFTLSFDTTSTTDGVHDIGLFGIKADGSRTRLRSLEKLFVLNSGQRLPLKDNKGKIEVPLLSGESEPHARHAFELPKVTRGVVAIAHWADLSWKAVEIAIGTGICPHRGTKLASATSQDGAAIVTYTEPELATTRNLPWFLHVSVDDAALEKAGQLFGYSYQIYTY